MSVAFLIADSGLSWMFWSLTVFALAVGAGATAALRWRGALGDSTPESGPVADAHTSRDASARENGVSFDAVVRSVADVIALSRRSDGALSILNRAEFLGFDAQRLPGNATLLDIVDESQRADAERLQAGACALRRAGAVDAFLCCRDRGGRARFLRTRIARVDWDDEHLLVVFTDVTDDLEEASRRVALDRARAASSEITSIGPVARAIAHDLNCELARVLACAEWLGEDGLSSSDRSAHARVVSDAIANAARLTGRMGMLVHDDDVAPTRVDLGALVAGLEARLQGLVGPSVKVRVVRSRASSTVLADPRRLEELVFELAANARDAMPDGGRLTVSVGLDRDASSRGAGSVTLTVVDSGAGVDESIREHVFEAFVTSHEQYETRRGCGLAIAREICRSAGGDITFTSISGRGTSFTATLPWLPEPADVLAVAEGASGARSPRVLLVEADEVIRDTVAQALGKCDYTVVTAASGSDALRSIDEERFDLVVADALIPGMSGADLCLRVRARDPEVAIVMISDYAGESFARATRLTRVAFLRKPFKSDDLLEAMTRAGADYQVDSPLAPSTTDTQRLLKFPAASWTT